MTSYQPAKTEQTGRASTATRRIAAKEVRHLCGGISDMTLWRWLNDNELGFPRPIYIGKRRYWKETDISFWLDAQTTASN